jgi:hypothetical protein
MKLFSTPICLTILAQMVDTRPEVRDEADALYSRATKLMSESPLIDTHVDLPQIIRGLGKF